LEQTLPFLAAGVCSTITIFDCVGEPIHFAIAVVDSSRLARRLTSVERGTFLRVESNVVFEVGLDFVLQSARDLALRLEVA